MKAIFRGGEGPTLEGDYYNDDYLGFRVVSISQPGDANNDGYVDDKDASILGANWMAAGADWAMGDFNDDHVVNDVDAAILAAHWNPATDEGTVPEPSTLVLLSVGGLLLVWRKRKSFCI